MGQYPFFFFQNKINDYVYEARTNNLVSKKNVLHRSMNVQNCKQMKLGDFTVLIYAYCDLLKCLK